MHVRMHAGMGDDEVAAIEQEMVRQAIDEIGGAAPEIRTLALELLDGRLQPVADLHIAARQPAAELVVMIAHDAMPPTFLHEVHGQPDHVRRARPAIDEIAQQDGLAALGMMDAVVARAGHPLIAHIVAEPVQQALQLAGTAVHVADQVERAGIIDETIRRGG